MILMQDSLMEKLGYIPHVDLVHISRQSRAQFLLMTVAYLISYPVIQESRACQAPASRLITIQNILDFLSYGAGAFLFMPFGVTSGKRHSCLTVTQKIHPFQNEGHSFLLRHISKQGLQISYY